MRILIRQNLLYFTIILILSLAYFATRVPNLTLQPIFADEAIYIRWAQVMRAEATLRFLPLTDGKPPLYMWLMIPFLKVFSDPLFAGRFLSILSGFATFLGVTFLSWFFLSKKTALISGLLIVVTPMIFFFDRMALVDSMLAAFTVWSLTLSLLLMKYPRLDLSFILGYIFGGGLLTKPPAFFNILVLPSTLLLFNWKNSLRGKRLLKIFSLWLIAIITAVTIYNILRLGPGFSTLNARNQDYVFSPTILLYRPLDPFIPHFNDLVDWLPKMLTLPILFSIIAGIILVIFKRHKVGLIILAWALIPLLIQMAFLKTFTARYILFSFPLFLVLAGMFLGAVLDKFRMKKIILAILLLAVILPQPLYFNFYLLTDPAKAPLPREERGGYLEAWTAGYGLKEIAQFLDNESKKGIVIVGTEGAFGTLPDGLQIYLDKNTNVKFATGKDEEVYLKVKDAALLNNTFLVANRSKYSSFGEGLELIKEFPKAKGSQDPPSSILLFKVNSVINK